jgi:integrase/recombinase XerC
MKAMKEVTQQLHDFMDYMQVEKNASLHTVNSYRADLDCFIAFARLQGAVGEALFSKADTMLVRAYIASITSAGYSLGTISRRVSSLKTFFRFLHNVYGIDNYPFNGIHIRTNYRVVPQVLSGEQVTKLLEMPEESLLGIRDRAILELLYVAALKTGELVRLTVKDVDLVNKYFLIYGVSNARVVPIDYHTVETIHHYLTLSRPELCKTSSTESLFANAKGGSLSSRSVSRIVKKYAESLGLNISPHTFRSTRAAHLFQGEANLQSVQALFGRIPSQYNEFVPAVPGERLKSVYKGAHPRA